MSAPEVTPITFPRVPVSTVTPFTYHDGLTFLQVLEKMREYINGFLIEEVNETIIKMVGDVNAAIDAMTVDYNARIDAMVEENGTFQNSLLESLSETINNVTNTVNTINARTGLSDVELLSRRKLISRAPMLFPGHSSLFSGTLYAQSFDIDTISNEIVVFMYSTSNLGAALVFYDYPTGDFKGYSTLANFAPGEGLNIIREGATRYAYTRCSGGYLGKYDITDNYLIGNVITPTLTTVIVGRDYDIHNGLVTTINPIPPYGAVWTRNNLITYDLSGSVVGQTELPALSLGTPYGPADNSLIPKTQGFTIRDGLIYAAMGGQYKYGENEHVGYSMQGLRVFSFTGEMLGESLSTAIDFLNVLSDVPNIGTRLLIENEGIRNVDGRLVSMYITNHTPTGGLLFFEECSKDTDAKVFVGSATVMPLSGSGFGMMPRFNSTDLLNPITGNKFDSVIEIADYMSVMNIARVAFYSTTAHIKDSQGVNYPGGIYVELINLNTNNIQVIEKSHDTYSSYRILTSDGIIVRATDSATAELTGVSKSGTISLDIRDGIVLISGSVTTNPITGDSVLATIPVGYRPKTNLYIDSSSPSGSVRFKIRILPNGEIGVIGLTGNLVDNSFIAIPPMVWIKA